MAQKVLSEAQMREFVEREVRKALVNENIDEGIDEGLLDALAGRLFDGDGNASGVLGRLIKEHMNFPDLMNLVIGIFGVAPIVKWLCKAFGIDINGPIGKLLVTALSGFGTVAVGDMIQNRNS